MLTIYSTDTVWGLGAPVCSQSENRQVRLVKGNPPDKPLSVLFYDLEHLREFLTLPVGWDDDERLNVFFEWEGTLAVPRSCLKASWSGWIYGESAFATVRCLSLNFLRREGVPFSTTSLNFQGKTPVMDLKGARIFANNLKVPHRLIADESVSPSGMASTILALLPGGKPECWRKGRFFQDICKTFKMRSC